MIRNVYLWALAIFLMGHANLAHGNELSPLDGLKPAELEILSDILASSDKIASDARYVTVVVAEPPKETVLARKADTPIIRKAFVVLRQNRELYEAVVNLNSREIETWELQEDAQPVLLDSEFGMSQIIVRKDQRWIEALARRGANDPKSVFCFPVFPGYFDLPRDNENRRLGMVSCFETQTENSIWGRPIEGLLAVVDYDEGSVVEILERDIVPIPEGGPQIPQDQPTALKALGPDRSRIKVSNSWVSWDKWKFHLRIDPREGPVLSQVSIMDGGTRRSVMYQGALSEMFVPYMDPTETWFHRAYLDIGEYGIGVSGVSLNKGKDCPADGIMMDGHFMNESGKISSKPNMICVFERQTGDTAWTHYEVTQGGSQTRAKTELVVRFIAWLGNYDYVIDWIFSEDGSLKGRVGASGIVQAKAVNAQNMSDESAAEEAAYGRLVAPGIVAVNHDHFFAFRLDLDVDGTENNLVIDRLKKVKVNGSKLNSPRRQIWQVFPAIAEREKDAMLSVNQEKPAMWRVANSTKTNALGHPVSYRLKAGTTGLALMDRKEFAQKRAAFTEHNLWVTPYSAEEKYAAGEYPNRHPGNAGLPTWTKDNRSIANEDIVLWYTIGMHHVVRTEDWPIMPQVQHQFELRPFDFFDFNPAMGPAE